MAKKQNTAARKELNEIELERASYLINTDELIFETLDENGRFAKPLQMGEHEDINLAQRINSPTELGQSHSGFC